VGASLLPIDQLSDADLGAWRELSESAVEPNPFFDPDFVLPSVAELDSKGVGLLVAQHNGDWTACMPVRRMRGWRRVPATGLVCWKHLYCFLGTPLLRPDRAREGIKALLEEGLRHGRFLGLDLMAADGPASDALEGALVELELSPIDQRRYERATLERRAEPDGYMGLKAKHRRNFERLRRRLEERVGAELTLRDRSPEPQAWEEFLRIESSGWKGEEGTGTAFATLGHGPFFIEVCRRLSSRGMLELVSAEAGNVTVAMLCSLVGGGGGFTFKIAADADYLEYSPGVQIEILYMTRFHSNGRLSRLDSCAEASNEMINRLWPDRRGIGIRAIPRPGPTGASVRPLLKGTAWLRRKARS
jgi:CelD/BcsL family acetyltransferase involved in cellulose biosynthesis